MTQEIEESVAIEEAKKKKEKEEIIVSFFPEGGHLIENVNNRVAFELRNQEAAIISPQAVFIKAVSGEILDTLQLIHNGRGTFETKQHHWIIDFLI